MTIKERIKRIEKIRIRDPALCVVSDSYGNETIVTPEEGYRLFPQKKWMYKKLRGGPLTVKDAQILKQWLFDYLDSDYEEGENNTDGANL